ncbi:Transcription initiation factor IIB [Dissophora ornata]|nr:Transcription initiation factor IIB [Dissophora ornata]
MYQNGVDPEANTHSAQSMGMAEQGEAGLVSANGATTLARPKAAKSKIKTKGGLKVSAGIERSDGAPSSSGLENPYSPHQQYSPSQEQQQQQQSNFQQGESLSTGGPLDEKSPIKSARAGKVKSKTFPQLPATLETQNGQQDFDGKGDARMYDSLESTRRRPVKKEGSIDRTLVPENGPLSGSAVKGGHGMAPDRFCFGSGMILVKKLPDGASSSPEGSSQFPPSQLSIKTRRDLGMSNEKPLSAPGTPATPSSASSLKKKRLPLLSEHAEKEHEIGGAVRSPQQPQFSKTELSPSSPPPPTPPARGKASRPRKGTATADADIKRSNEITRFSGPAWMESGITSANSNSMLNGGGSSATTSTAAPTASNITGFNSAKTFIGDATNSGMQRRPPLSPSEHEKRKRKLKRIKIEDMDVRQVQRTSSSLTDMGDVDRDAGAHEDPSRSGRPARPKQSSRRAGGQSENGKDRDNDDEDDLESEGEDEVLEEGEGESGDITSSQKRRSSDEDDEDHGDDDTGAAGGGGNVSHGGGGHGSNGGADDQGRGSGGGSGRKGLKRKSNSNLSGAGSNKKTKEKTKGATSISASASAATSPEKTKGVDFPVTAVKGSRSADDSTSVSGEGRATPGRPRKGSKTRRDSKDQKQGAVNSIGSTDSDAEIEYLGMEDDINCPQMFGIEESDRDKELSSGEEEAEYEEDAVKDEPETEAKSVGIPVASKKTSNGAGWKPGESVDMPDDIQKQGREWVNRLGMPESAWEECYKTYERVKRLKELKNRQPVRKRDAILAAILYIVCRNQGSPRTFSEICTASGVKRGDIGSYYRLMLKILEPSKNATASARDTDAEAFMVRASRNKQATA